MVIWKGYGILVLVIAVILGAITGGIFVTAGSTQDLGAAIGVLISAPIIWFVGRYFNATSNERTLIDKNTGQQFLVKPNHSLFFIKMQYWAFIAGGIGIIMLVDVLMHGKSTI
jgi:hypothetical protein